MPAGKAVKVTVLEMRNRPNYWRVWLNHRAVSRAIYLPQSHDRWTPIATAESWDGGTGGTCNTFLYRFRHVAVAQSMGGGWHLLDARLSDQQLRDPRASSARCRDLPRGGRPAGLPVPLADYALIKIGVPSGASVLRCDAVRFDTRTQPCETAWPRSCGRLVPWMPTTPPPGHSVSFE